MSAAPRRFIEENAGRQIGGLIRAPGWDTVDEVKANMHGWETWTFKDNSGPPPSPCRSGARCLEGLG